MKQNRLLVTVLGLCTALLGGYCIYAESVPVLRGGTNPYERLDAMTDRDNFVGLSLMSQNLALRDCLSVMAAFDSSSMQLQSQEFRDRVPSTCSAIAQQVLSKTPAHGAAYLTLAHVAAHQGNGQEMDNQLRASQALSPSEARFASVRVDLAEANIDSLSQDGLSRHESDLLVLLRGQRRIWSMAQLYVNNESARERIGLALEQATNAEQARFLRAVRTMLDLRDN